MRVLVVGLGVQGKKRVRVAGRDVIATVDPVVGDATHRSIYDVPADSYDAALVCTPDHEKLPILEFLLNRGKHVLAEKPLLSDTNEVLHNLKAIAKTAGVACYTAYNHRFEPQVERLRQVLSAGSVGSVYLARLFYGNGTAVDVSRSPWRDAGLGVLGDLGSHLLDLCLFLLGTPPPSFEVWSAHRFENSAPDHVVFGSIGRPALQLEVSLLSWRNTFTIDVVGSLGSATVVGLCKWGQSVLTVRQRVLPSGHPIEQVETVARPDPTWEREYAHFGELCRTAGSNLDNDMWINDILKSLTPGTATKSGR